MFHEFNNQSTDSINQNDSPEKLNERFIYKSTVLTEIESRLNVLQLCLEKAINHTIEVTSALETQQRTCNDANNWIEDVTSQLHQIITERQETPTNRDTAQKYLDLIHVSLWVSSKWCSVLVLIITFYYIFLCNFHSFPSQGFR